MSSEKEIIQSEEHEITDPYLRTYAYVSSCSIKFFSFLASLKLEVLVFFYMFGYMMKSVTSVTMIMDKVCRTELGYGDNICTNLAEDDFKDWKVKVETTANNYHLYHSLIGLGPSVVLACFLGPWSDTHGRKPPLIMALIGGTLDGIGSILCAHFINSSVKYYLIPPIFSGFSGGFVAVFAVVYSYASDVTESSNRTFKYALLEISMGLGIPFGGLAGGWLFKYSGYVSVFSVMLICMVFCLVWVLFVLKETKGFDNSNTIQQKTRNLFRLSSFIESYKATAKRRPFKGRIQIWMLLLAMSLAVVAQTTNSVAYIYTYHLFDWSNTKYSTISSVYSVLGLITIVISVPLFTKIFKFGDPTLGLIGSISLVAKYIGMGLAEFGEGIYYLGNLLGVFSSLATLAGRARISKIVSKDDLGKVFSFISSAEGILPIIATIFVTRLFNAGVENDNPGLTYLVIGGISSVNLFIFLWLACLPSVNYEELHENEEQPKPAEIDLQSKVQDTSPQVKCVYQP